MKAFERWIRLIEWRRMKRKHTKTVRMVAGEEIKRFHAVYIGQDGKVYNLETKWPREEP